MNETIKITCGSPEVLRRLQTDIHRLLKEYETTMDNALQRRAAGVAAGKVRIVSGER